MNTRSSQKILYSNVSSTKKAVILTLTLNIAKGKGKDPDRLPPNQPLELFNP